MVKATITISCNENPNLRIITVKTVCIVIRIMLMRLRISNLPSACMTPAINPDNMALVNPSEPNLIIWIANSQSHPKNNYDSYYEPIFFYTKTDDFTFNKRAELRDQPPNYWSGKGKKFIGLLSNTWYDIKRIPGGCLRKTEVKKINKLKIHPCAMSIRLAERAIKVSSNEGDMVIDPFVGSGTTCIAAYKLNRNSIGIEQDQNYINVIKDRIAEDIGTNVGVED